MKITFWRLMRRLRQTSRLMVGLPSYEVYLNHMRERHPDQTPMTYEQFFRERQQARYGGGSGKVTRCC